MRVSIVGTGYVGLITGVCFAEAGHDVWCVDVDEEKVARIQAGDPPIHEAGLPELLRRHVGGRLRATTDLAAAVHGTDVTMIAVGTPTLEGRIDLAAVETVARSIGAALASKDGHHTVVVKSTVIPGTTEDVVLPLLEETSGREAGVDLGVGMNPEFLREGVAIADALAPDRIVLGAIDERTADVMAALYAGHPDIDVLRTTPRTAEMIKYAANGLLATLISFSNEIAALSAASGVDVTEVLGGVHLDRRFAPLLEDGTRVRPGMLTYLEAGCGFGGSCFPKDVQALADHGVRAGVPTPMLDATLAINAAQPLRLVALAERELGDLTGRRVTVLGLAFKPGTDDVRESPALRIVPALLERGARVTAWDPLALAPGAAAIGRDGVSYTEDLGTALADAEAVVVVTRWPELDDLGVRVAAMDPQPVVVDGRRIVDPGAVERYAGIGRP